MDPWSVTGNEWAVGDLDYGQAARPGERRGRRNMVDEHDVRPHGLERLGGEGDHRARGVENVALVEAEAHLEVVDAGVGEASVPRWRHAAAEALRREEHPAGGREERAGARTERGGDALVPPRGERLEDRPAARGVASADAGDEREHLHDARSSSTRSAEPCAPSHSRRWWATRSAPWR